MIQKQSRVIVWGLSLILLACSSTQPISNPNSSPTDSVDKGTLQIRANGEDLVRVGMESSDGWKIKFDSLLVNLVEVKAYQSDPPYDPKSKKPVQAKVEVGLDHPKKVDLVSADQTVMVGDISAPIGYYNAISWKMAKSDSSYPMELKGTATKSNQTIEFSLKLDREFTFVCGEYVGETKKGILKAGQTADLEVTFHLDHLFGDGNTAATDSLNQEALGFNPLAVIATNGKLEADLNMLQKKLSSTDYQRLIKILPSLGHVGEGHCQEINSGDKL